MKADIYVNYEQSNWEVATYINEKFDEWYYEVFQYKKDALKQVTQIKKNLFFYDEVDMVTVTIDLNGGIEQDTFTYTKT